jgi:hypothetical protein
MKFYLIAALATTLVSGSFFIAYQNQVIKRKETELLELTSRILKYERTLTLREKEIKRLNKSFDNYQKMETQIETKYITKKVPVFTEVVKEVPAEIVVTMANEESNEILADIRFNAVGWMRN